MYEKENSIIFVSTPSHGGYRCDTDIYVQACKDKEVPKKFNEDYDNAKYTWFESDCESAYLYIAMPELFEKADYLEDEKTLKNWFPSDWEKWKKQEIKPGESIIKDEMIFNEKHKNDWVVYSSEYCTMAQY